jgi:uncharacterized protein (DUF849 family)
MLLQACLNGARQKRDHRAVPSHAAEIARDALAAARAGAGAVHVHPRDAAGQESLAAECVAAVCDAVRAACGALPIGVTTAAWIQPDVERRVQSISQWTMLPEFASVNLSEDGAVRVIELLNEMGIGVEAGVWTVDDARMLFNEGLDSACMRVLVEVDAVGDPLEAVALATRIDSVLDDAQVMAPRLHHGVEVATWAVIDAAMARGHNVRIGLEDTLVMPDGSVAVDNEALVREVAAMARTAGRSVEAVLILGPAQTPFGTLQASSSSHAVATASLGARQSPRGESEPPDPTFGPLGMADRLN